MIFPTLEGQPVAENVNLNEVAKRWRELHPEKFEGVKNPFFTDPEECQRMVEDLHRRLGVAWSYGGWLEDRSTLWKGGYMEPDRRFIHLGVDLNVPTGTPIAADALARVERFDIDADMNGGWGPRLILDRGDRDPNMLILAHLATSIRCGAGDLLLAGQVFAEVGSPEVNGHWYPHLHIQAISKKRYYDLLKRGQDLSNMDGYCPQSDDAHERSTMERHYPDPLRLMNIT